MHKAGLFQFLQDGDIDEVSWAEPYLRKIPTSLETQKKAMPLRRLEWPITTFSSSCPDSLALLR